MKNKKLRLLSFGLVATFGLLLPSITAHAAPDYEVHNTTETIGGTWASANSDVLIGPNAQITVTGDWYVTANNFYIHPTATITGSGTLHIMNPSTYNSKPAATTLMDGGSVVIGCKVSIENGSTVTLTAINPAVTYAASGFTETVPQQALTALGIGSNLNFNNVGAHIIMGGNNVVLASAATITRADLNTVGFPVDPTPGTAAQAYLVTNGTGVVTKQGLASNAAFDYPIGQSASSDYTPATVTNDATAQDVSIAVRNYSGSASSETLTANGMDRSWNLFTSAGAKIKTLALTHSTATNGANYIPATASIVRQQASGVWSSPAATTYGGSVAPTGETGNPATLTSTSNAYYNNNLVLGTTATTAGATNAWYSKSSDVIGGIKLTPFVFLEGSMNGTTSMRTDLQDVAYLPTSSTTAYTTTPRSDYANINNPAGAAGAVADWVTIELRTGPDADNASTVVEQRSFLVKSNGAIVDPTNNGSLNFSSPAGNYFVAVRHRNHLGAMTASAITLSEATTPTIDFRSAATPTYSFSNPALFTVGSNRALWAGDVNSDGLVYFSGPGNDRDALLSLIGGVQSNVLSTYNKGDINMDGDAYFTGPGNDRDWLLANPLNGQSNAVIEAQLP